MLHRIPVVSKHLRIRKNEPVAYNAARSELHKLNESAYLILGLVDGARSIDEIALMYSDGDTELALEFAPKVAAFLARCEEAQMIEWRAA